MTAMSLLSTGKMMICWFFASVFMAYVFSFVILPCFILILLKIPAMSFLSSGFLSHLLFVNMPFLLLQWISHMVCFSVLLQILILHMCFFWFLFTCIVKDCISIVFCFAIFMYFGLHLADFLRGSAYVVLGSSVVYVQALEDNVALYSPWCSRDTVHLWKLWGSQNCQHKKAYKN